MAVHYVIVHIQYCYKERLVCIVKLFSDDWISLAAVVEKGYSEDVKMWCESNDRERRDVSCSEHWIRKVLRMRLTKQEADSRQGSVGALSVWNSLSHNCRSAELFNSLRRNLKTELFDSAYKAAVNTQLISVIMRLWFNCDIIRFDWLIDWFWGLLATGKGQYRASVCSLKLSRFANVVKLVFFSCKTLKTK